MKCRIVSDGTAAGTEVFDANGRSLAMRVTRIEVLPGELVRAIIEVEDVELDMVTKSQVLDRDGREWAPIEDTRRKLAAGLLAEAERLGIDVEAMEAKTASAIIEEGEQ